MKKNNKAVKTAGFCLLAVLFVAVAAFCVYIMKDHTRSGGENDKKNVSVKKSEKEVYEIGEDAQRGEIVCNVSKAEIIENYNDLDDYYQKRKYLVSSEEYAKNSIGKVFPEEVHFLHIRFSLTNNGDSDRGFSPTDLNISSALSEDAVPKWPWRSFLAYDGQYLTEDGEETGDKFSGQKLDSESTVSKDISIQPGETIVVDFIGEFSEYENMEESLYDYNLYLPINDTGKKITTDLLGQKIQLNLERRYKGEKNTAEPVLYAAVRNIADMKSRSFTNPELTDGQAGYYRNDNISENVLQHGEAGEQYMLFSHRDTRDDEVVQLYMQVSQPMDFEVTDWENIPEDFAKQGNLEKMAERYQEVYGYKKEDLKVLFLDITYLADGFGKKYEGNSFMNFYEHSYLFYLDSDEKWQVFGTADDWIVMSNSKNPENIGSLNMEQMLAGDAVTARMAYILPPDFYEKQDALYYGGGDSSPVDPENSWTKIELK